MIKDYRGTCSYKFLSYSLDSKHVFAGLIFSGIVPTKYKLTCSLFIAHCIGSVSIIFWKWWVLYDCGLRIRMLHCCKKYNFTEYSKPPHNALTPQCLLQTTDLQVNGKCTADIQRRGMIEKESRNKRRERRRKLRRRMERWEKEGKG